MLTGEIRSQIDGIWNAFWSGGISNPIEVIEQITYLLFLRRLDDLHTLEENRANRLKQPMERRIFPKGKDKKWKRRRRLRGDALVAVPAQVPCRDVRACRQARLSISSGNEERGLDLHAPHEGCAFHHPERCVTRESR